MPAADKGTVTAQTDTAPNSAPSADPMEGFTEALSSSAMGWSGVEGNPLATPAGDPEKATAVETSAEAEAPKATPETPEAGTEKPEETPEPAKTVNFDGFSDSVKSTWERLLKGGHVTGDEIEASRKDALRQDLFSKKTAALARDRESFDKEKAEFLDRNKEDLDLLRRIRESDHLHSVWLRMSKGDYPAEGSAETGDLVDERKAAAIADQQYERREKAREAAEKAKQEKVDARKSEVGGALKDQMKALSVSADQMDAYLAEEFGTIETVLTTPTSELIRRIALRHDLETMKSEATKLREQLSQRTTKQSVAARASLPPARREVASVPTTPLSKTEADLGLDQDWSNVTGFGNRGD